MIQNKNGFTLVELIVTIAIIGVMGLITAISVESVINKSSEELTQVERQMLEVAAQAYANDNVKGCKELCIAKTSDLKKYSENAEDLENKVGCIVITKNNNKFETEIFEDSNNPMCQYKEPNAPELANGMIPVIYDETKKAWVKADTNTEWYDYNTQMWANAVTIYNRGDFNGDCVFDDKDDTVFKSIYNMTSSEVTDSNRANFERADFNHDGEINIIDYGEFGGYYKKSCLYNAEPGTVIPMNEINAMWVWIPRFKYRITSNLGSTSDITNPPMIDVAFESGTSSTGVKESVYREGITDEGTNTNYYTHPAFRNGNSVYKSTAYDLGGWSKELKGFWVGKFETTGTSAVPTIKPNYVNLAGLRISKNFVTALKFAGGTMNTSTGNITFSSNSKNIYGLNKTNTTTNTHMMKNTEWGAVAILSQSQFGKMGNNSYTNENKEIYPNLDNANNFTGFSNGSPDESSAGRSETQCPYDDIVDRGNGKGACGAGASTTGTIYGIYDMAGGGTEDVMGNWNNIVGMDSSWTSGFNGTNCDDSVVTTGISFPKEKKYYDSYTIGAYNPGKDDVILGDTAWENSNWYSDNSAYTDECLPWITRGFDSAFYRNIGIFAYETSVGNGSLFGYSALRTVLIP